MNAEGFIALRSSWLVPRVGFVAPFKKRRSKEWKLAIVKMRKGPRGSKEKTEVQ